MTHGVLPHKVEVRTLAARAVELEGRLDPAKLPRLQAAGVSAQVPVRVQAKFFKDEENRYAVDLAVQASVTVSCQRCLGALEEDLESRSLLVALWSDEEAGQLPPRYDPLVTEAEMDLWQVVEDELLLVLPSFSYHSDTNCGAQTGVVSQAGANGPSAEQGGEQVNPFNMLKVLKEDNPE